MKLSAGERMLLANSGNFVQIRTGKVEVYAVTTSKLSFHRLFLTELSAGEAAYPALDEFHLINIELYAAEDAQLVEQPFDTIEFREQMHLCRRWFAHLGDIPWIRMMADKGDDILKTWRDGNLFMDIGDAAALRDEFSEHESTLSMHLGLRFRTEDKRFLSQIGTRRRQSDILLAESVANLTGEETAIPDTALQESDGQEEAEFLMEKIESALSMPKRNLTILPEVAKRLDSLGLIRRMSQKARIHMRLITLEQGWHHRDSGVLLGYAGKDKHLAAFLPQSPKSYLLVDKARPTGVPLTDEVAEELDGSAFVCYAGLPGKALSTWDFLKFLVSRCWKTDYRAIVFSSLIASLVALTLPIVTETVFQDIVPTSDAGRLATVTQISVFAAFSVLAVSLVRSIAIFRISSNIDMTAEASLLGRVFSLPTGFFRKIPSGELVGKLMSLASIKGVLGGNTIPGIFDLAFSVTTFCLMCYYSVKLAAVGLLLWAVYAALVTLISYRVVRYEENMITAKNKTAGIVQQIFTGLAKFRLQGAETQAFHLWSKAFGEEWKWNLNLRWLANYRAVLGSVQPLIVTLIFFVLVTEDMKAALAQGKDPYGSLSYAQFVAFLTAFTGFNTTLNTAIPLIVNLFTMKPHVDNLRLILREIPEGVDDRMEAGVLSGAIQMEHLSFSYTEDGPEVLHDLNLRVEAGENLAIVGRSGCGKSTLIRLLLGFEKPKSGAIFYDGQDLSDTNLASVRTQMGVVLQNGQLMTGDIFTNIVGTSNLSMEDAWAAAEAAGIAEDIRQMPMGMQTVLSEGSGNISGGQRQRILIARALAGRPAILIFDEATSALDNRTQAIVTESLKKMRCTRLVVAHRLSTIQDADRIVVLDKGRIAECGTYEELVERGGLFADLARRQLA